MIPRAGLDEKFIRRALLEARKGLGWTSPNPAVGAVIVKNGRILAVGHHRAAGEPHAEIEALRALKSASQARGATLYITLEPCSTHGRTPPCTDAIIEHGIVRVVYGATDPNPSHAGRAAKILHSAGINVKAGILAGDCASLNEAWNHWIVTGLPFVIAKCGMSLDGKISSHPSSRWITGKMSRMDAMHLRASVDAVLIGGATARIDDPKLTLRGVTGRQPLRVVWSKSGRIPRNVHLLADGNPTEILRNRSLKSALKELGSRGITSVLIEGGGRTLGEAFDHKLVQQAIFYVAPQLLGGPVSAVGGRGIASNECAVRLLEPEYTRLGDDVKITGRCAYR